MSKSLDDLRQVHDFVGGGSCWDWLTHRGAQALPPPLPSSLRAVLRWVGCPIWSIIYCYIMLYGWISWLLLVVFLQLKGNAQGSKFLQLVATMIPVASRGSSSACRQGCPSGDEHPWIPAFVRRVPGAAKCYPATGSGFLMIFWYFTFFFLNIFLYIFMMNGSTLRANRTHRWWYPCCDVRTLSQAVSELEEMGHLVGEDARRFWNGNVFELVLWE